MNKKYCVHCWPSKRTNHILQHISYYFKKINNFILSPLKKIENINIKKKYLKLIYLFVEFLSWFKIVQFVENPDETQIYNRSLIFFKEAKKRKLNITAIKYFGVYINEFRLIYNKKKYYFEGTPLSIFSKDNEKIDNKFKNKTILQKNFIPTSDGKNFTNKQKAYEFGLKLGFPLVVKPNDGSLSHHITVNIKSPKQLKRAIKIAKIYSPNFIVEKYIKGDLFRVSVVGKKYLFVSKKDKANIVGDGKLNIAKLIDLKNSEKIMCETKKKNTTLHKIPINKFLKDNLQKQGLSINSIAKKGQKIYLQDKYILSHGCDVINIEKKAIHPDNIEMFLNTSKILNSDIIGIDFIGPDISKSYKTQNAGIIEVNSLPYIDMHQNPSHGKPSPVAKIVWDFVLKKLDNYS